VKGTSAAIKVGVLALAGAALFFWAFSQVRKTQNDKKGVTVYALFRNATGLVEKSRVVIAGIVIGQIANKSLVGNLARIDILIYKGTTLYDNASVAKRSASLLGEYFLEIDPGQMYSTDPKTGEKNRVRNLLKCQDPNKLDTCPYVEAMKDGDRILTVIEATTTDQVLAQVNNLIPVITDVARDIRQVTSGPLQNIAKNVEGITGENRAAIKEIIDRINQITVDIRGVTSGANREIDPILRNVREITENVKTFVGKGGEADKTAQSLRNTLDRLENAIGKLDRTLGASANIAEGIDRGEGTVGRLVKDEALIDNVEGVVEDVGGFVRTVTRLQTIVGLRSEFNIRAATLKTYVELRLQPAPDKYYSIELIDDPRGRRQRTETFIQNDNGTVNHELKTEFTNSFRFSFQFAKRIDFATFRFGIKESSGGIGTDLLFFKDRLEFRFDLFDFTSNVYPRLKALAAFEVFKRIWVVGGVDDIFNGAREGGGIGRDYFVGAQLRFNDEDLKSLLLVGGSAIGAIGR
jgi:phospholipid/cholesterol/gamma-HCH transport system substrate-binding protein